eukprot:TRINITY_DN18234_c0_g1_i1.p1 TRINITY_DN18234_c0_g1~~TRINITY_DN18234_c0_g1_i1.p1  ORF type:complete len:330 (-),score=75.41 TRINITY_DN18234_c0_g1_i1:61-960(-)
MEKGGSFDKLRADGLIAEAEKKMNPGFLGKIFANPNRLEDAAECLSKAANLYRIGKQWEQSGKLFERAAQIYIDAKSGHDAATAYINASNCYKKSSSQDSTRCLDLSSTLFAQDGKFSLAAKNHKTIAEMAEKENDYDLALHNYEKSAEYYDMENSAVSARACKLKVAQYAAGKGEYTKAIRLYEEAAKDAVDSRMGPYACKDYFLKAGLCYLAHDDAVGLRQALGRYKDLSSSFERERECKFLEDLMEACENYDSEQFTTVVSEYNNLSVLDNFKVGLLAKVKEALKENGEDEEEGLV